VITAKALVVVVVVVEIEDTNLIAVVMIETVAIVVKIMEVEMIEVEIMEVEMIEVEMMEVEMIIAVVAALMILVIIQGVREMIIDLMNLLVTYLEALEIEIEETIHILEMMIDMGEVIDGMTQGKEVVHMEIIEEVEEHLIVKKLVTVGGINRKAVLRMITPPKDVIFVLIMLCLLLEMK